MPNLRSILCILILTIALSPACSSSSKSVDADRETAAAEDVPVSVDADASVFDASTAFDSSPAFDGSTNADEEAPDMSTPDEADTGWDEKAEDMATADHGVDSGEDTAETSSVDLVEPLHFVGGRVSGGGAGAPLAQVKVSLISGGNQTLVLQTAWTDADGEYLFEEIKPGCYAVFFEKEGYYIATGLPQSGETNRTQITVARNLFINNDHALLLKEEAFATVQQYVFVDSRLAAIQFSEHNGTAVEGPGKGAMLDGNIFWNNAQLFKNLVDTPTFKTE